MRKLSYHVVNPSIQSGEDFVDANLGGDFYNDHIQRKILDKIVESSPPANERKSSSCPNKS